VNPLAFIYLDHICDARPAVQEGDRIAQLILEQIHTPEVLEVAVSLIAPSILIDSVSNHDH
jgi:dUTPase